MAGTRNWPGGSSAGTTSGFTGVGLSSGGFSVPDGRECANGMKPVRLNTVFAYCRGRGATVNINLQIGSAVTSAFNVSSGSSATSTGTRSITADYSGATSGITVRINGSGSKYFGRNASGSGSTTDGVTNWAGALTGQAHYIEAPTVPRNLSLTPASGKITASWDAPSDDGGTPITGYKIEWADNEDFTDSDSDTVDGDETTFDIEDLAPGEYFVRVFAINVVTTRWSTTSLASEVETTRTGIGGHRWDGDEEVPFTQAFRWDGEKEVALTVAKRWDGDEEVDVV